MNTEIARSVVNLETGSRPTGEPRLLPVRPHASGRRTRLRLTLPKGDNQSARSGLDHLPRIEPGTNFAVEATFIDGT